MKSATFEKEETRLLRFSPAIFGETLDEDNSEYRSKSKSVVDLPNFLPEIGSSRKFTSSAPILKEDFVSTSVVSLEDMPITPAKHPIQETESMPIEIIKTTEYMSERRLSRRLSRNNSQKSTKSTPRSIRDSTPKATRALVKPKESLQQALGQMNNAEWEITILGLQALSRIAQQYPDTVDSQIHTVCVSLGKHIKNLRSQVARSACYTASELFKNCRGLEMVSRCLYKMS